MSRQRRTSARRHAVVSEHYAEFAVGARVNTVDGLVGTITEVSDGPFPGTEQYIVMLDDDMGGGEYDASMLTPVPTSQAAAVTPQQEFANGVADTLEGLGGPSLTRYEAEMSLEQAQDLIASVESAPAEGSHVASTDYPELADILVSRPPLPHSEPMRMSAAKTAGEGAEKGPTCTVCDGNGWLDLSDGEVGTKWERTTCLLCQGHGYLLPDKSAAAVDWDQVYEAYWCEQCGFKGQLPPSTNGLDVCPQCGATERAVDIDGNPFEFGLAAAKADKQADEHVLIATAGLWDRVRDLGIDVLHSQMAEEDQWVPGHGKSGPEWCRFRKNSRCFFPKTLNAEATKTAGYAVWNPEDRGHCPRFSHAQQADCPVGEPGPDSGDPQARVDATERWEDGGQRLPPGWELTNEPYRRASLDPLTAAKGIWEFTASWSDVRNKAKRIRQEGGVRIISAPRPDDDVLTITAEVKGDNHTYETTLLREPGRRNVASWSCGCAWASYSWGRSGQWKKYEGRMCSHALAVQYEAQAQGMNGRSITEQATTPPWRMDPFHYTKPPRVGDLGTAASLRPVCLDGDLDEAPAERIARESTLSVESKVMLFRNLKALVRGTVRTIKYVFGDSHSALVEGITDPIPLREITYPTWHPNRGLSLSHRASLASDEVFAFEAAKDEDGPTHAGLVLKAADTGRVLMLQRCLQDEDDPAAGTWEFPGGGIEDGDTTSLHAAMREFAEEVGVAVPEGGHVSHVWTTGNGVYTGHVVVIPTESLLDLSRGRDEVNPDDPDGDYCEQSAWWDPNDAKKNPALRSECKDNPWAEITKAASAKTGAMIDIGGGRDVEFGHLGDFDPGVSVREHLTPDPEGFVDVLNDYNDPPEPTPALPFTEGEIEVEGGLHSEALVVEALADPETAPEMAEAIGESLASSPPAPGDPRLAWLMSAPSGGAGSGAGGGTPATASDSDIAAQAKAHLAKVALKEFTPAEQREIIEEGLDVVAANLEDLDITGTHYAGLEEAFQAAEAAGDDEDGLFG